MKRSLSITASSLTALFIAAEAATFVAGPARAQEAGTETPILGMSTTSTTYHTLPPIMRWLPSQLAQNLAVLDGNRIEACLTKFDKAAKRTGLLPKGFQITEEIETGKVECGRFISADPPEREGKTYPGCWVQYTPASNPGMSLSIRYDVSLGFPYRMAVFDGGVEGSFITGKAEQILGKLADSVVVGNEGEKDVILHFMPAFGMLNRGVSATKPDAPDRIALGKRVLEVGTMCGPGF